MLESLLGFALVIGGIILGIYNMIWMVSIIIDISTRGGDDGGGGLTAPAPEPLPIRTMPARRQIMWAYNRLTARQ